MILRKPYAILIKNFRLIHLVLLLLSAYLIYRTNIILTFFNDYLKTETILQGFDISRQMFDGFLFLALILVVLISFTILALMLFKKKPIKYYIVNFIIYSALIFLFYYALITVDKLEVSLVDIRVIRAIRDFIMGAILIETISTVLAFVRATGFNIKKFDFASDLQDLDIEEGDREEFEVDVSIDYDSYIRRFRRSIRNIKYTYLENKVIINIFLGVIFGSLAIYTSINNFILNKVYNENVYIGTSDYVFKINDTYTTQKDYQDKTILADTKLLVVSIDLKTKFDVKMKLDSTLTNLVIGDNYFRPINTYDKKVFDIGYPYDKEIINKDYKSYILVYEIPTKLNVNKAIFMFKDFILSDQKTIEKHIKVRLQPENLDVTPTIKSYKFGDTIDLSDSVLKTGTVNITDLVLMNYFQYDYQFCVTPTYCYTSFEYIRPSIYNNYPKALLAITGTVDAKIKNINNLYDFINGFSTLQYQLDEIYINQTLPFREVISKKARPKDTFFIETVKEVTSAKTAKLSFKIRNKIYEYVLFTQ